MYYIESKHEILCGIATKDQDQGLKNQLKTSSFMALKLSNNN